MLQLKIERMRCSPGEVEDHPLRHRDDRKSLADEVLETGLSFEDRAYWELLARIATTRGSGRRVLRGARRQDGTTPDRRFKRAPAQCMRVAKEIVLPGRSTCSLRHDDIGKTQSSRGDGGGFAC